MKTLRNKLSLMFFLLCQFNCQTDQEDNLKSKSCPYDESITSLASIKFCQYQEIKGYKRIFDIDTIKIGRYTFPSFNSPNSFNKIFVESLSNYLNKANQSFSSQGITTINLTTPASNVKKSYTAYINHNLPHYYFIGQGSYNEIAGKNDTRTKIINYRGKKEDDTGTLGKQKFKLVWDIIEGDEFIEKSYGLRRISYRKFLEQNFDKLPTQNKNWERSGLSRIRAFKTNNNNQSKIILKTWEPRQEGTLKDYLENRLPPSIEQRKQLIFDILEGICRMHNFRYTWKVKEGEEYETSWWHNDLKFANIFYTEYENGVVRAQIADFDLSYFTKLAGTSGWWPPEIIKWRVNKEFPLFNKKGNYLSKSKIWRKYSIKWGLKKDAWQIGLLLSGILMHKVGQKKFKGVSKPREDLPPLPSLLNKVLTPAQKIHGYGTRHYMTIKDLKQKELSLDIKNQKKKTPHGLKPYWNLVYHLTRIDPKERKAPLEICDVIGVRYKD